MTVMDETLVFDRGRTPPPFLSRTMPSCAIYRARFWCSCFHTWSVPWLPYWLYLGLPLKRLPHPDGEEVVEGSVDVLLRDLPLLDCQEAVHLHIAATAHVHS
jgi:hypothetical protein